MTKRFISFGRGIECLFGKYVVYNLLRLVHFELWHPTKPEEVNKAMWMEVHAKEHTTKDVDDKPARFVRFSKPANSS